MQTGATFSVCPSSSDVAPIIACVLTWYVLLSRIVTACCSPQLANVIGGHEHTAVCGYRAGVTLLSEKGFSE